MVSTLPTPLPTQPAPMNLARWTQASTQSALQEMLAVAAQPEILSFALGLPAAEMFPRQALSLAAARVLEEPIALQYQPALKVLKAEVVALMAERGVSCGPEQIFLTSGAQQGMNLLVHLLLDHGGPVLTEELVYTGFQQVLLPFQPQIYTVPTDLQTGIDVDAVERVLASGVRPAMIYVVTDGHNPLSVSVSQEKRLRLVELAQSYQVPIIEDDAYGFLHYGEHATPPLRALNASWVCYVGSFSKILAPALRAGWLVVPEALMAKLSVMKEASDINTTTFAQRTIAAYLATGQLPSHLKRLRGEYQHRCDAMQQALKSYFPQQARWQQPSHGLFLWVELPETIDTTALLRTAIDEAKVAFIPGQAFAINGGPQGRHAMRLNFSNCTLEQIETGIARLGRLIAGR